MRRLEVQLQIAWPTWPNCEATNGRCDEDTATLRRPSEWSRIKTWRWLCPTVDIGECTGGEGWGGQPARSLGRPAFRSGRSWRRRARGHDGVGPSMPGESLDHRGWHNSTSTRGSPRTAGLGLRRHELESRPEQAALVNRAPISLKRQA